MANFLTKKKMINTINHTTWDSVYYLMDIVRVLEFDLNDIRIMSNLCMIMPSISARNASERIAARRMCNFIQWTPAFYRKNMRALKERYRNRIERGEPIVCLKDRT